MKDKIIEIGAVKVVNGNITERFSEFVNPEIPIPFRIEQLTSINDSMVAEAPTIDVILPRSRSSAGLCDGGSQRRIRYEFIKKIMRIGIEREDTIVDTVGMARFLLPQLNRFKLDTVAKAVGVSFGTSPQSRG